MHLCIASLNNAPWVTSLGTREVMFIGRSRYEKMMGHWDWLYQRLSRLRLLMNGGTRVR
jgi:hypothetical protein